MELGHCFESALNVLMNKQHRIRQINANRFCLVHGIAIISGGQHFGEKFCHAWIEFDLNGFEFCYDAETDLLSTKETYYVIGRVTTVKRYSEIEALKMAFRFSHYGPWEKDLVEVETEFNPTMKGAIEGIHYN